MQAAKAALKRLLTTYLLARKTRTHPKPARSARARGGKGGGAAGARRLLAEEVADVRAALQSLQPRDLLALLGIFPLQLSHLLQQAGYQLFQLGR